MFSFKKDAKQFHDTCTGLLVYHVLPINAFSPTKLSAVIDSKELS